MHHGKVVRVLQDMFELVTSDIMTDGVRFGMFIFFFFFGNITKMIFIFCDQLPTVETLFSLRNIFLNAPCE